MSTLLAYDDLLHREQVIQLWNTVFGYETAHNLPSLAIDKKREVNDELFFVATENKTVTGTILAGYDGHRGWLYAVAVHPNFRHRGLGKALVRHAENALGAKGCMKINLQILHGNDSVCGFYAALGYAIEPRISMGKRLEQNIPHNG